MWYVYMSACKTVCHVHNLALFVSSCIHPWITLRLSLLMQPSPLIWGDTHSPRNLRLIDCVFDHSASTVRTRKKSWIRTIKKFNNKLSNKTATKLDVESELRKCDGNFRIFFISHETAIKRQKCASKFRFGQASSPQFRLMRKFCYPHNAEAIHQ